MKYIIPPKLKQKKYFFGFDIIELIISLTLFIIFIGIQMPLLNFFTAIYLSLSIRIFNNEKNLINLIMRKYKYYKNAQIFRQRKEEKFLYEYETKR